MKREQRVVMAMIKERKEDKTRGAAIKKNTEMFWNEERERKNSRGIHREEAGRRKDSVGRDGD